MPSAAEFEEALETIRSELGIELTEDRVRSCYAFVNGVQRRTLDDRQIRDVMAAFDVLREGLKDDLVPGGIDWNEARYR